MASLTLTSAATYLVQTSGTISDSVVVTGTANLAGTVVIDPPTRLTQRTTYTIVTAGTVNGTFSTANFLMANNFARNPVLSYLGNSVFLTLDPGLLSPVLSANATGNQKNVAGAIDNALLGGSNMSNAFSAIFNFSGDNLLNGSDAALRRDRHRFAADHVQRHDAVFGHHARSVHRRPRR